MHPFSTPWKHQKTVEFAGVFKGEEKGCIRNKSAKMKQRRKTFGWQWTKWGKEKERLKEKGCEMKMRDWSYRRLAPYSKTIDEHGLSWRVILSNILHICKCQKFKNQHFKKL